MQVKVLGSDSRPVVGHVEITVFETSQVPKTVRIDIDRGGRVELPELSAEFQKIFRVVPDHTYVQRLFVDPFAGKQIICPKLPTSPNPWWLKVLGSTTNQRNSSSNKIRVGVLDIAPRLEDLSDDVCMFDSAGVPLSSDCGFPKAHGGKVVNVLKTFARSCNIELDVAIVDISLDDDPSGNYFDTSKILNGAEWLAREFEADLINLSGGIYREESIDEFQFTQLVELPEIMQLYGSCMICAVGNNREYQIAAPARSMYALGVGAVGLADFYVECSYAKHESRIAREMGISVDHAQFGEVFHYFHSCLGDGLNVVAPGVGLPVARLSGEVEELFGTSFACPCVTGVAAATLSKSDKYLTLNRHKRATFAADVVKQSCVALGDTRFGCGIPILA